MPPHAFAEIQRLKPLLWVAMSLVIVQILLGGWTSTNYAALACPDLPTCQGRWWPNMDFTKGFNFAQDIGPNYLGGLMENSARTAIHFSHRIGAIVVTLVVFYLVYRLLRIKQKSSSQWAIMLAFVLLLQISLGLSNVYWSLPLPVAVAHNAVGAMLLLTFVGLCHRFYTSHAVQAA
jgi:cytochrome c oxidase assembly protein subunit 15